MNRQEVESLGWKTRGWDNGVTVFESEKLFSLEEVHKQLLWLRPLVWQWAIEMGTDIPRNEFEWEYERGIVHELLHLAVYDYLTEDGAEVLIKIDQQTGMWNFSFAITTSQRLGPLTNLMISVAGRLVGGMSDRDIRQNEMYLIQLGFEDPLSRAACEMFRTACIMADEKTKEKMRPLAEKIPMIKDHLPKEWFDD